MSADASTSLFWADDEHTFRLGIGQWRELQEKVNGRRVAIGAPAIGPQTLLNQFRANDAWPDDVRDVLRLGLVGGGKTAQDAHTLLRNNFDGKPPLPHMKPAFLVLFASLVGVPSDPIESKKKDQPDPMSRSSSPASTEMEPPSASLPPTSTAARSGN